MTELCGHARVSPDPEGSVGFLAAAERGLAAERLSRARAAATALVLAAAFTVAACASPPGAAPPSPSAASVRLPGPTEGWPSGGPMPPELVGTWAPTDPAHIGSLVLTPPHQYAFETPEDSAGGNIVVRGNEIDFFNAVRCGLSLPAGVGRYTWTLMEGELGFAPLNEDTCGRVSNLRTRKYRKVR